MQRKRFLILFSVLLLLTGILALLYAAEKPFVQQARVAKLKAVSLQTSTSKNMGLVEKLNYAPEYANLPAEQKVRIILRELQKGGVKARGEKISKKASRKSVTGDAPKKMRF